MPRNGSGSYALPVPPTPFVNGTTADATQVNAVLSDIAAALTGSMAADGQTPFTGTLSLTHPLVLANGVAVQGKDTGGTARQLIALTNANNVDVVNAGGANIRFVNQAYSAVLGAFDNAGNFTANTVVASGNVQGANYGGNNGHSFNFGWNGSVLSYVDGTYIGALQLQGAAVAWGTLTGIPAICYNNGGTYGINVTGNAATATSATSATNATNATTATQLAVSGHLLSFAWAGGQVLDPLIDGNNLGTLAFTASDYRLKEAVETADFDAVDAVARLHPVIFKWKNDGRRALGMLAHEVAEVVPEAVARPKDAVDDEGHVLPQGVDPLTMIAVLVKAVQELHTRLDALEARR